MQLQSSQESFGYLLNLKKQEEILKNTVNSDLIKKYPIKQSYQRAFLKWLMNKVIKLIFVKKKKKLRSKYIFLIQIEEKDGEICDIMYITYCNLISSTIKESIHYRHFLIENDCISIKESTNIISEGTTGLCSWQVVIIYIYYKILIFILSG